MTGTAQDYGAWRIEQHRRAQAHAFAAAERAQADYNTAVQYEDTARQRTGRGQDHLVPEARQLARFHGVRSAEAATLATMWAHVAQALAAGELPMHQVVEVHGTLDDEDLHTHHRVAARRPHPA